MDVTLFVVQVGNQVMPVTGHVARYCNPQLQNVCYIPENEKDSSMFSECAKAIFSLSSVDIKRVSLLHLSKRTCNVSVYNSVQFQFCIFNCYTSNTTRVTEITAGHVAVTNVQQVQMRCANSSKDSDYTAPSSDGAICKAIINDLIEVKSAFPCRSFPDDPVSNILYIIPATDCVFITVDFFWRTTRNTQIYQRYLTSLGRLKFQRYMLLLLQLSNEFIFKLDNYNTEYSNGKFVGLIWLPSVTILLHLQLYYSFCSNKLSLPIKGRLTLLTLLLVCDTATAEEVTQEVN